MFAAYGCPQLPQRQLPHLAAREDSTPTLGFVPGRPALHNRSRDLCMVAPVLAELASEYGRSEDSGQPRAP